jgi:hypothetical protein
MKLLSRVPFPLLIFLALATHAHSLPNPAATLCSSLGYTIRGGNCTFPDGSRCDQWAFWRGECGQNHHICTLNQGKIIKINDQPVCDIDGTFFTWTLKSPCDDNTEWTVELVKFTKNTSSATANTKPAA